MLPNVWFIRKGWYVLDIYSHKHSYANMFLFLIIIIIEVKFRSIYYESKIHCTPLNNETSGVVKRFNYWSKNCRFHIKTNKYILWHLVVVFFSKNNKSGSQHKYITIKYFIMRNKVKDYKVLIKHISIELMIMNLMTKALLTK